MSTSARSPDLPPATLQALHTLFARCPALDRVVLFGSRAMGTAHERSDIDLVAYGPALDRHMLASLLMDIDELDIPWKVDLQAAADIRNAALAEHIERVGHTIYQRPGGAA